MKQNKCNMLYLPRSPTIVIPITVIVVLHSPFGTLVTAESATLVVTTRSVFFPDADRVLRREAVITVDVQGGKLAKHLWHRSKQVSLRKL